MIRPTKITVIFPSMNNFNFFIITTLQKLSDQNYFYIELNQVTY